MKNDVAVDYVATTRLGEKGQVTIPKEYRDRFDLRNGAPITVFSVGRGLLLIPDHDRVEQIADAIAATLAGAGITEKALLASLPAVRERLARERYPALFKARRRKAT